VSRFVFKLPDLGEGTVEAEIVAWHVKPGDVVAEEDVIVEVMTEKASVEMPSPVSGRVLATNGAPGDMVPVGSELIVFETDVNAAAAGAVAPTAGAQASSQGGQATRGAAAASAPTGGAQAAPSSSAATSGSGKAATGSAQVSADGALTAGTAARTGSAGASASGSAGGSASGATSTASGQPGAVNSQSGRSTARGAGASGAAGSSGGTVTSSARAAGASSASAIAEAGAKGLSGNGSANGHAYAARGGRVATSPAIRRRAHEAGVDLTQLAGSGPNGRILREDFEAFVSSRSGPKLVRSRPVELRPANEPETEEIKVIGIRRVIAQRMSEAKRNIPHFAYVEEIDVTELESLRRHLNSKLAKGEPSLTYLPFIASALVRVLRDFPQCNALYDSERNVIIRHRSVHLGVATQTPDGLKVPVIHDAQSLSLSDLAAEMRRVTEAARTNKASRDELSGSTITLTSLGKLGGIASTPIINAPEVSIIGINRAVERPMVHNGAITIRRMMNLSSSFDHRFVDGFDAAAMIQALKERIEHPATIFID
jgi:2-oxoisovalerate dehydrogenase E2 component (dihydrolipoyl transacylase)